MGSEDEDLRAAIAASLGQAQSSTQGQTIDLTGDSTDDDDVIPTFPKSKSVVSSAASRDASIIDVAEDGDGDDVTPIFPKFKSVDSSAASRDATAVEPVSNDSEDEDIKRAIALSLQESVDQGSSPKQDPAPVHSSEQTELGQNDDSKSTNVGFLGLNRKKMEEERLARLAKRKAEETAASDQRETKQARTESRQSASSAQSKLASVSLFTPSVQFPTGVVKKTFSSGHRRTDDDIKIEEVFQSSDLELAVLSSFMWDTEWLFSKLDIGRTRFIMVMQAKDDATKRQYELETAAMTNLRLCFPPMGSQVNCMHSKLMLLFHPTYLRIAVPTANLVPYDWGETGGVMENSVFLIDLPKKDSTTPTSDQPAFYKDLVYFLKATTLHDNIIAKLEGFDFSKTAPFAFVHTIGGSHSGSSWKQTGYCGLGRSIENLGLKVSKPLSLDFVTSSLGSLTPDFMRCIYFAAQGDTGLTELALRTAKSLPIKHPSDPQTLIHASTADEWKGRVRVYFPSQETVSRSRGGPNAAGTICFQSKWFAGAKFPRDVLRDCVSVRDGLVMHNKILYVQPDEPIALSETSECHGWTYVGSANLSESAWGRLVHDRSTKQPKLNCRNWECGVVVPVIKEKKAEAEAEKRSEDKKTQGKQVSEDGRLLDIFKGTIPVPMQVPGRKFEGSRLRPWYFVELFYNKDE
ncbi:tyrosyl-DNA phosphodiesterase-domain-containing protein [Aspergillus egyptiacus]|nr:tyrosyl-DNA phosphodiesterase-domain-containing protein [Aspergillus egyptiacus]